MLRKINYGLVIAAVFIISGLVDEILHGYSRQYHYIKYFIMIVSMSLILYAAIGKVKSKKSFLMFKEIAQIGFYSLIIASIYHLATSVFQFVIIKSQFLENLEKDLIRQKVPPNQIVKIIQSFSSNDAVYYTVEGAFMTLLLFVCISGILTLIVIKVFSLLTGSKVNQFNEEKS